MAYSDYGAFVWCNGERRTDKEDSVAYASLLLPRTNWLKNEHHGVMGDGDIRVICHKQGLPEIWERTDDDFKEVEYFDEDTDFYSYGEIDFEYKGYCFKFKSCNPYDDDDHYIAEMTEPNGTFWKCEYDYMFGAGFEDEVEE